MSINAIVRRTFGIRELLWVALVVALVFGWYFHSSKMKNLVESHIRRDHLALTRLKSLQEKGVSLSDSELIELIAAISDPYPAVATRADRLLRHESGINEGFGDTMRKNQSERLIVAVRWSEWYLESRSSVKHSETRATSNLGNADGIHLREAPETFGDLLNEADEADWDF